ncbi:hypothetical protein [Actinophytocola sp. NPDC049390]|uniref:hypothetical protein n=1 Tax=Actinophytocola sp. NPDC049390 TaxID=3363894 RepID=UPI0037B012AF
MSVLESEKHAQDDDPDGNLRELGHVNCDPVRWSLAAGLSILALGAFSLWSGPAPLAAPWDNFILLDGGYRMFLGQAPGTDFGNPIGPLVYGLVSWGMGMQDVPSLAAVTYGNLVFLGVAALLAWIVAWRRMRPPHALGFTVFVGLTVVAVRPLGYAPDLTSYAMLYNRYGWVLYATLLVLVLMTRGPDTRGAHGQGAVLGILLGLSFYCKISYFVVGVGAVVLGLCLGTLPRRLGLGVAAVGGFLAVGVTFWLAFGIDVTGYVGDIAASAGAQGGEQRLSMLANSIIHGLPATTFAVAVLAVLVVKARRQHEPVRALVPVSIAAAYVLGSSVLVSAGNSAEGVDMPALVVVALLLHKAARVVSVAPTTSTGRTASLSRLSLLCLAGLLVVTAGPVAARDAVSLGNSAAQHATVTDPPRDSRLAAPHLRDFVVPAHSTWQTAYRTANQVPDMLNDGFALLRRHVRPTDTVTTVALTNPFSFALSLPPARGVPLWWDVDISFDDESHPAAERVFENARWVMIPRMAPGQGCCQETVRAMLDLYGSHLDAHYVEVERTDDWILLTRSAR